MTGESRNHRQVVGSKQGSGGVPPPNTHREIGVVWDAPPPRNCAVPPLVVANPFAPIEEHGNHLPHWQQDEVAQFVTWRLGDSLPRERLETWKQEKDVWMRKHPKPWDESSEREYHRLFSERVEDWLDAGAGACILREPENRRIVESALRHFDGARYVLWAFVVMPNHVHALFSPSPPHLLEQILHSWKSFTAKEINRRRGQTGMVWQEDYWDRLIRSGEHFERCVRYIRENPVKARLADGEFALCVREGSGGVPPPE